MPNLKITFLAVLISSVAFAGDLPNPLLTPGASVLVSVKQLCVAGYSKTVRNVPESVAKQVYAEYGLSKHKTGEYEIDHLISLEIGGSNDIKNLWPQSYLTKPWNAHVKDRLENRLHAMVCDGDMTLQQAQYEESHDWISAYHEYVGGLK